MLCFVTQAAGGVAGGGETVSAGTPILIAIISNKVLTLVSATAISAKVRFFLFLPRLLNPSFHLSPTHSTFPTTMATPKIITLFLLKKDVRIAVSTNIPMHV
jgi:hypothetical protein